MAARGTYPSGSVRDLIDTDLVTPATRAALNARLSTAPILQPRFFTSDAFATMAAVCARLIPQPDRARPIDLAGVLDTRLADGASDGWRYAKMPADEDMYRRGVIGIEASSVAMHRRAFTQLPVTEQDEVLHAIQSGRVAGDAWAQLDPACYFGELLALVTDIYYAHPLASEEIGYAGMADAHGWQAVGFGARADHEPVATLDGEAAV